MGSRFALMMAWLLSLSGCAADRPDMTVDLVAADSGVLQGTWVLSQINRKDVRSAGSLLTLSFGPEQRVKGTLSCGSFESAYRWDGSRIVIAPSDVTALGCSQSAHWSEAETTAAAEALSPSGFTARVGDALYLKTHSHELKLLKRS